MNRSFFIFILALFFFQCGPKEEPIVTQFAGKPEVPSSIMQEHVYLLDQMRKFTLFNDSTGIVANKIYEVMKHHFQEEEDFALPPLGLLPLLADGKLPENSDAVILLTEKLRSQLTHMSAEHQMIKAYLDELIIAATKDGHTEIAEFVKEIHQHAKAEEEIYYPAAILVGDYLKLKSSAKE